jgi:tetratricopeptide (TPR) repeat protein
VEHLEVAPEQLAQVEGPYQQGLFVQAYEVAQRLGPLASWSGTEAVLMAGRLAEQLGNSVLARWLIRRAQRSDPCHAKARYYHARYLARRRGPFAAWRWMHETGEPRGEDSEDVRVDWYAFFAELASTFRDFDAAEKWLGRALDLGHDRPWLAVCRATILECEDRYHEALAAAQEALELHPWYCPAVESAAHLLTLLDREAEAAELLAEATARTESPRLVGRLYALRLEGRQYDAAREALERCASLALLADKTFVRWLAAQRSEVAYHLGDIAAAIRNAKLVGRGFFETIAARLEDPLRAGARSVLLPVGFVRQHHLTCGPATLSAISRFWRKPADHLEVAEEICYDGTPAYHERKWAESHGWEAREFTVTEESAATLLDREVPFTFTTDEPAAAHLQAVIGYDGRRGTFWIRDPFWHNTQEAIADALLDANRSYGPRGMAMLPLEERSRLDGVVLPDAALWDRLHELDEALMGHRRDEADAICRRLAAEADGHRIGLEARRRLACYDGNPSERLIAIEELLKLTPDAACLQLERLGCLRDLVQREQRMAIYRELCEKRGAHSIFLQQYAQELGADGRRHAEAIVLLHRAIRQRPAEAGGYCILAGVLWNDRRFEEAFELYRFATCLNDKEEAFAGSYFRAAQWFKRTEEAFDFLRKRFERFGRKSSCPARTLVQAYLQWNRTADAVAVLEEAMRLRPDDGELQLFAADSYLTCSGENVAIASSLIEKAKGAAPPAYWLRSAARLASREGKAAEALQLWRQLLQFQPLANDVHQAVARLLAETEGKASALAHLATAVDRFPHNLPLHRLRLEWIRGEPAEVREAAIRLAVSASPNDAWLCRELAFFLAEQRRSAEAWQAADAAGRLEPTSPAYCFLCAGLLRDEGKIDEAKSLLREAIGLSVDNEHAIQESIRLCSTAAERREVLAFVKAELLRQVTFGDGLLAFRNEARGTLEAEEMLTVLHEALRDRPDLWHAWAACVRQLLALDRRDEAWELACRATDRFPRLPVLWLDRAAVCRARQDRQGERDALETACHINPDWGDAVRALADFYERQGEFGPSRDLLERAVLRQPLDVNNRIMLAETLWRRGKQEAAIERIRRALELDPRYDRAWSDLKNWATSLDRRQLAIEVARGLTEARGGEVQSWFCLADALDGPGESDERLATLDRALALDPRLVKTHDLRAVVLAEARRWEEARQACRPPIWGDRPPVELRGRFAWIDAKQGDLREAIAEMRKVLADEPGYWTGWSWLWLWCRDTKDYSGCLVAAEAMVRIAPQHEISLGYLGEAARLNNDRKSAYAAFQRAFELNPGYEYAGNALFDLQLADGKLNAAETTLTFLQRHNPDAAVRARAVQLAARGRVVNIFEPVAVADGQLESHSSIVVGFPSDSVVNAQCKAPISGGQGGHQRPSDSAAYHLRCLCTMPSSDGGPIAFAVKAMAGAGLRRLAEKTLEESLTCDGAHVEVGRQWVHLCVARQRWWGCGRRLRKLVALGAIGVEAAVLYIETLAKLKQRWRFRSFLWRNQDWIRQHSRIWGSTGHAMLCFQKYTALRRWMADWRQRNDLAPWMLLNLAEGLRAIRRDAEAAEVSRHALTLTSDRDSDSHRVWLAADAICKGNTEEARQLLGQVHVASLTDHFKFLQELTTAVVEMTSASETDQSKVFRAVQTRLHQIAFRYRSIRRGLARRRFYLKCLRLIAQRRGGFAAQWWLWMQWLSS